MYSPSLLEEPAEEPPPPPAPTERLAIPLVLCDKIRWTSAACSGTRCKLCCSYCCCTRSCCCHCSMYGCCCKGSTAGVEFPPSLGWVRPSETPRRPPPPPRPGCVPPPPPGCALGWIERRLPEKSLVGITSPAVGEIRRLALVQRVDVVRDGGRINELRVVWPNKTAWSK